MKKFCLDCGKPKSNKGLYCKKHGYIHRTRPRGLVYKIVAKNKGWFEKGVAVWNKGIKGTHFSPDTEFKKGEHLAEKHPQWAGDSVGYNGLHSWIRKMYGKAKSCEFCGRMDKVQWASKLYTYSRSREDWIQLCYWCHRKYDRKYGWGVATKKFPELRRENA